MRIAFFVGPFPKLSKTFILDQITGLIDCGIDVDIYANKPGVQTKHHRSFCKYNLDSRIFYPFDNCPSKLKLLSLLIKDLLSKTGTDRKIIIDSLNIFKYGKHSLSLNLFYKRHFFSHKKKYDIIHAHFGPQGLDALKLLEDGVIEGKLITSFHGIDITTYIKENGNSIYNKLFSKGNLFLPISQFWQNKLINLGCDIKKITTHRMGIDCSAFQFSKELWGNQQTIRLTTIARLTEKKGLYYSIQAVANLLKTNNQIIYQIIGGGSLYNELQNLIKMLDIQDNVKLLGWMDRDKVIEKLNKTNVLIAHSVTAHNGDMEGIPMVLMEAMAMGIPVVSTYHSGIPELIIDGQTGFLVPEKNIKALSKKIESIIQQPANLSQLILNARQCVEKNFNNKTQIEKLIKIYNELL